MREKTKTFSFLKKELIKKIKKETLAGLLGSFIECIAILGTVLLGVYIFFRYVFNMYFLSYWKVDNVFYSDVNLAYSFIHNIFIIMILIIIVIPLIDRVSLKKKFELFMYFYFVVLVTGKDIRVSVDYILIHFTISIVAYSCCLYLGGKIRTEVEKNTNNIIKKIYDVRTSMSNFLVLPVSVFVSVVLIALITACFQREYKVIKADGIITKVVLYSTNDYYIVADCEEKNNVLYINNNAQQKINIENVKTELIEFKWVKKA